MSTQPFSDAFTGVNVTPPMQDTITFSFGLAVPDAPMPPRGVQFRLFLLRIAAGPRALPRDYELAELKLGESGLILELDGHGGNRRNVEPVRAAIHPQPGTNLPCSVTYSALTGALSVTVSGTTLGGSTALRAGSRPISVTYGLLPGEGNPALQYPHGWGLDLGTAGDAGQGTSGQGTPPPTAPAPPPIPVPQVPAPIPAPQLPPASPAPASPPAGAPAPPAVPTSTTGVTPQQSPFAALLPVLLTLYLQQHASSITPEEAIAAQLLIASFAPKL